MNLRLNPVCEKMLPKMSEEEFAELKVSIQQEGQHYPIVANEDLEVLDGRNRFRACTELGIEPDFEMRHFEDKPLTTPTGAHAIPALESASTSEPEPEPNAEANISEEPIQESIEGF